MASDFIKCPLCKAPGSTGLRLACISFEMDLPGASFWLCAKERLKRMSLATRVGSLWRSRNILVLFCLQSQVQLCLWQLGSSIWVSLFKELKPTVACQRDGSKFSFILVQVVQVSKWLEWLVVSALAPPVWSQGGRFWTLWQTWRHGIWSTSSTPNLSPAPTSLTRPCTFSQQSQTGNQTQQDACQHFFQDWQRWWCHGFK